MPTPTFRVTAANREYRHCPVSAAIDPAALPRGPVVLADDTGVIVPAQAERTSQGGRLHWIIPALAAGQSQTYTLLHTADLAPQVELVRGEGQVDVRLAGQRFTTYCFGPQWSKPYLHPLLLPAGSVTRRWPMEETPPAGTGPETHDHPHHKGCYVAWGEVNGADCWSEEPGHGRIAHQDFTAVESGPVFARLAAENHWMNRDGQKLLTELREYRFYHQPATARSFDLTVRFLADAGPVKFGDTKEGGLCSVRVATSMDAGTSTAGGGSGCFVNAYGGTREKEGWGQRAPWCDYFGPVGNQVCGIAIFDHPANLRYPTWWHVRDYGLMTANPFGLSHFAGRPGKPPLGDHELPAGGELTFRYRVFVHAGDPWRAGVAGQYHHWINPPGVTKV